MGEHGRRAKKLPFNLVGNVKLWLAQLGLVNKSPPGIPGEPVLLDPEASCSGRRGVSVWLGSCPSLSPFHVSLA